MSGTLSNTEYVGSGPGNSRSDSGTTIASGGSQYVGYDYGTGTATSTTIISGGFQDVGDDYGTGTVTNTIIDNGGQNVGDTYGTGTATSTTINSGGIQRVGVNFGTGTATDTTISGGGTQYVGYADDTFDSGTATSTTILSGGTQYVGGDARATGIATSTTLSGGTQYVNVGGTATATTIYAGGLEEVQSGGTASTPVIDGGTLRLDNGAAIATGPIDFAAVSGTSGGTLDLTGEGSGSAFTSNFTAAISGFTGEGSTAATSDIIDVTGTGSAGDHVVWTQTGTSGTLQVEDASNNVLESLTLDGSFGQQHFVLTETGSTDQITYNNSAPCYRRGTLIEAARGQKTVEALKIGDKVRTASGALRPIKWIGQRSYAGRFVMGRKDILPVCIKAGALGENVPVRDLWVSPNHAMYLSGVLIEAKDLINGVSIVQAEQVESVNYVHIELDSHDVIIAEGALAETFIDDDSRAMFQNAHDYATLYGEDSPAPAHYCAPRLSEGYEVEAVRQRLAQRTGLLHAADAPQLGALRGYIDRVRAGSIAGWAQNTDAPEAPVCLDILADGKFIGRVLANIYREDLKTAGLGSGHHGFAFTPCAGLVFAPDTIEVRRSLDGARLDEASAAPQMRKVAAA
jgi:O-antigen biosynthesis protein